VSIDVGAVGDFSEGCIRVVRTGERDVGVLCWAGRLHALSTVCPHQGGPVCAGIVSGRLVAARPGGMELDEENPIVACPWHGWEFDARSGRAIWDASVRLRTWRVEVADGRVLIDLASTTAGT
jgi:nitrite reductase/ring-hydroxylating ferredoxin subunit